MSYTKTNWTDGTTPVDASNLNKIEDALVDQDSRIDANTDLIDGLASSNTLQSNIFSSIDDLLNLATKNYQVSFAFTNGTLTSALTNGASSSTGKIIIFHIGMQTTVDFIMEVGSSASNAYLFFGRLSYGTVAFVVQISGTSIAASSVGDPVVIDDKKS